MRASKLLIYIFCLIMLQMLSSCSGNQPEGNGTPLTLPVEGSQTIGAIPSEKVTEKPTVTLNEQKLAPTALPTQESTHAPIPPIIPTHTWMPIPTLVPQEKQLLIENNLADIRDCKLPCWWKITPGQTTWEEARQILSPLDTEEGPFTKTRLPKYFYTFQEATDIAPLGFELAVWIDDDRVIAVQTNSRWIRTGLDTSSLSGLLKTFGQPGQIWVRVNTDSSNNEAPYQLELFFPDQGVLIHDNGRALLKEKSVILCPQKNGENDFPPSILLFSSLVVGQT